MHEEQQFDKEPVIEERRPVGYGGRTVSDMTGSHNASMLSLASLQSGTGTGLDLNTPVQVSLADLLEFKRRIEAQAFVPDPAELQMQMQQAAVMFSKRGIEVIENNVPVTDSELTPLGMEVIIRKGVLGQEFDAEVSEWQMSDTSHPDAEPVLVFGARAVSGAAVQSPSETVVMQEDETSFQFADVLTTRARYPRMDDAQMMSVLKKLQLSVEDSPEKTVALIADAIVSVVRKKAVVRDVLDVLFRAQGTPNRSAVFAVLKGRSDWTVIESGAEIPVEYVAPAVISPLKRKYTKRKKIAAEHDGEPENSGADALLSSGGKNEEQDSIPQDSDGAEGVLNEASPDLRAIILDIAVQLAGTIHEPVTVAHVRRYAVTEISDSAFCAAIMYFLSSKHGHTKVTKDMFQSLSSAAVASSPDNAGEHVLSSESVVQESSVDVVPVGVLEEAINVHETVLAIAAQLAETLNRPVTVTHIRKHIAIEAYGVAVRTAITNLLLPVHGRTQVTAEMLQSLPPVVVDPSPAGDNPAETDNGSSVHHSPSSDTEELSVDPQSLRAFVLKIVAEVTSVLSHPATVQDLRDYFETADDTAESRALVPLFSKVHGAKIITPDMLRSTFPSNGKPSPLDMTLEAVQAKYGTVGTRSPAYRKRTFIPTEAPVRTISRLREAPRKRHTLKPDSDDLEPAMPELSDPDAIPAYMEFDSLGLERAMELEIGRFLHRILQTRRSITSSDIHKICRSICALHADRRTVQSVIAAQNARNAAIRDLHEHFGDMKDTARDSFSEDIFVAVPTKGDRYTGPINTTIKFNEDPRFKNRAAELDNEERVRRLSAGGMQNGKVQELMGDPDLKLEPETDADRYRRQHTVLTSLDDLVGGRFSADFSDDEALEDMIPTDEQIAAIEENNGTDTEVSAENFAHLGIDPYRPTSASPGSEAKVLVLQARHDAGLPFWHDEDKVGQGSMCDREVEGEFMSWEGNMLAH